MRIFDIDTPAGRALELVSDLVKQGRMSSAEARVIEELIWHPDMPESLRRNASGPVEMTMRTTVKAFDYSGCEGRTRPAGWQA